MIELRDVVKAYGATQALRGVSLTAPAGDVTAFLGPNGAGKTTALRVLVGLARADSGSATVDGCRYVDLPAPRRAIGAVLDPPGFHPGRTGRDHVRILARAAGIVPGRVDEVLDLVGLTDAAGRRAGGYSHGMRQRLALAGAMLGDPPALVLDEPATGLDPAGIAWLRQQLHEWAEQGRTVLFSSHGLAEVEMVADRVVIVGRGEVLHEGTMAELTLGAPRAVVRTSQPERLRRLARLAEWEVNPDGTDRLLIQAPATEIAALAAREGIELADLSTEPLARQLEELFLELTGTEARP
jgi:ABC-2 type transport system ATP-binding protein